MSDRVRSGCRSRISDIKADNTLISMDGAKFVSQFNTVQVSLKKHPLHHLPNICANVVPSCLGYALG